MRLRAALLALGAACALGAGGCAPAATTTATIPAGTRWVATWAPSLQITEPRNQPPPPGLAGSTIRQVMRTTIGGSTIRVRLSNIFGDGELSIASARIARSAGGGAIDAGTDHALTFGGSPSVVIAKGASVTSDPLRFDAPAITDLAVTMRIVTMPEQVTGHPGSRTTSYIRSGDHSAAASLADGVPTDHWYVLAGIDVAADAATAAIVTLGNSITDGRGSGTNLQNRWPDNLARRLQADARTRDIAVINAGIGGNAVLQGGLGPTALARLDRDVLEQPGARWLIVLEGVNDLGGAPPGRAGDVADGLIDAYGRIITRAHAGGLRVYGATVLPFAGSQYEAPGREEARTRVNDWIRTSGAFDAVIDFDAGLRDPANPIRLLPAADTGDHLHPNENGYRMMADMIDLSLFRR